MISPSLRYTDPHSYREHNRQVNSLRQRLSAANRTIRELRQQKAALVAWVVKNHGKYRLPEVR